MANFIKEWRVAIFTAVALLIIIAAQAVFMNMINPYIENKRTVCYQTAQKFTPPLEWRWNPRGSGDGCELRLNGTWFPADMVRPGLK